MTTWKAPGKLILFGEHSVVYGKHAVAAALSLATSAVARFTPSPPSSTAATAPQPLSVCVHTVPRARGAEETARLEAAVRAMAGALGARDGALELWVRGDVPEGAGLGSSAALCVASAAAVRDALADYRCEARGAWRAAVDAAALAGERVFHASPSGVDNAVSTHGGALLFARGAVRAHLSLSPGGGNDFSTGNGSGNGKVGSRTTSSFSTGTTTSTSTLSGIRVLVVDTGVPRSTAEAVRAVRARRESQPAQVDAALARMDAIALEAFARLQARPRDYGALDALVDENHRLLRDALGVGHPAVDRAVALCAAAGVHAKITGAGCGGCVFGFLAPSLAPRTLDSLTRALTSAGMRPLVVSLGAPGVSQVPAQPPF